MAAVLAKENGKVKIAIMHGPPGRVPTSTALFSMESGTYRDEHGNWSYVAASNEATPTMSYYILLCDKPSMIMFGAKRGERWVQLIK